MVVGRRGVNEGWADTALQLLGYAATWSHYGNHHCQTPIGSIMAAVGLAVEPAAATAGPVTTAVVGCVVNQC